MTTPRYLDNFSQIGTRQHRSSKASGDPCMFDNSRNPFISYNKFYQNKTSFFDIIINFNVENCE